MIVETEQTPNPDTLKFLPGKIVSDIGPMEFKKEDKNIEVPLASKILSLEGTVMVFFGKDFITVKKEQELNWEDLKHGIIAEINEHYSKRK
jgi:Scaffold protein Nfu/NifU N terminal.